MIENIPNLYSKKIKEAESLAHPRVLINICSHGNEIIGLEVERLFKDTKVINGSVTFNFANPWAVEQHKRFIEKDLNRSFPGSETGLFEERVANQIMKFIPLFDYVFDIHSTQSELKDSLIMEDNLAEIQKMILACHNVESVLYMKATSGTSIFLACRLADRIIPGLAFEYGDNSEATAQRTYSDLVSILNMLGLTKQPVAVSFDEKAANQFECYKTFPKNPGDILTSDIKNFELVSKGDVVAYSASKTPILAPEDFYPILFGESNYIDIFGFMARKM